ncbi:hypothetical protein GOV09_02865 [Candidatus Woesearchaeota archaeon]|nr:hypothetical protein [Candidatus Woesearchaeota archaeon]
MNKQINLRLPTTLLKSAKVRATQRGFTNVQDFIKETLRQELFEPISKKELILVKKLIAASDKHGLYGSEKELYAKLKRK